jgi:hypothetical protein
MDTATEQVLIRTLKASQRLTELVLEAVQLIKEMNDTIRQVNDRMTEIELRGANNDQDTRGG